MLRILMDKESMGEEVFSRLEIPQRGVAHMSAPKYRIYSDEKHFIVVEAESAQIALERSGVKQPLRIQRDEIYLYNVLDIATLTAATAPAEIAAMPQIPDEITSLGAGVTAEEKTEGTPAGTSPPVDDIDKLLQG
jgi:hypothetical protein